MKQLLITIAAVVLVGCKPYLSIHEAAHAGAINTVKQHLATGTDVNAKDDQKYSPYQGATPLIVAAGNGHKKIVDLLIIEGANVNAANDHGDTALHRAAYNGNKTIFEKLITEGADVIATSVHGWTALHHAAIGGNKEIVELLIAKGSNVNAKNDDGKTPLDIATHPETAALLRKHGGKHSIFGAAAQGNIEAVKEHLADGADLDAQDRRGDTPLHHAAIYGYKEIAKLLIAEGADVNAKNNDDETPLGVAEGETADLLRKHGGKTAEELKAEHK